MKAMVPFYYAVVSLFFDILGGFCARCYQISKGEDYLKVLRISTWNLAKNSWTAFCLPVLVIFSDEFRKLLMYFLIYEAKEDYTVSISETDKDSLVDSLMEKIAASLSLFYFINLDSIANSTMRSISDKPQCEIRRKNFLKGLSFYKRNIFAQTVFCLWITPPRRRDFF